MLVFISVAKSPVFTHLTGTLTGLSTIRAYNAETILQTEFDFHQDAHTACWYTALATSSAFGFILDFISMIFTFCIIFYYMLFDTSVTGTNVGLLITQMMAFIGMVQAGMAIIKQFPILRKKNDINYSFSSRYPSNGSN